MVAWCDDCRRPVNQYCDICGDNFGTVVCDKYACGGTMMCPICGGKNLKEMKDVQLGKDPHDYSRVHKEERSRIIPKNPQRPPDAIPIRKSDKAAEEKQTCPLCGFPVERTWKYCPECGVSFRLRK